VPEAFLSLGWGLRIHPIIAKNHPQYYGTMVWKGLARAAGLVCLAIATCSQAQWEYDPRSVAMLPPYCKYTPLYQSQIPGGSRAEVHAEIHAEIQRWIATMGLQNFRHMHHYCKGLEITNHALYSARTKLDRDRALTYAIGEMDYTIQRVAPDFAMLPEMLTRKGENLIRLGRAPEGVAELNRAIELNPAYWPPYAALSDRYKEAGDLAAARDWLERGLSATPDSKALKRRLAELDKSSRQPTRK
jgi:tetratricopeptide (TPR) repeat protein